MTDLLVFFKDYRIFFLTVPLASSLQRKTTKNIAEDGVPGTGNLIAVMVGGCSTVGMNLFPRQEIPYLGCQMSTFNLSPL